MIYKEHLDAKNAIGKIKFMRNNEEQLIFYIQIFNIFNY